ncbi:MAG: XrtA/PEP-CTERM system histidine kinase PrsK [Candidatus Korobacteraceae bacterium]|jgi:putative PEP-CTERM system histidine kinase
MVTLFSLLPWAAAVFSLITALVSLLLRKSSPARWYFFAGMVVLGLESLFTGLSLSADQLPDVFRWMALGLIVKSLVPGIWLGFSLTWSRPAPNYRESLKRLRIPVAIVALLPVVLLLGFRQQFPDAAGEEVLLRFGAMTNVSNVILLVACLWILTNLEQTFRSAVGTGRWRIKFVILGLAVIFGARLYVLVQELLYSGYDLRWSGIESGALLIGCVFLAVSYRRTGFVEIDVYPSRAVLRTSLTALIGGGYLFTVGVLANIARRLGGAESFQAVSFVVLLGAAGLAVLLLSDRLRQSIRGFVGRHFARAQHDSVQIWTDLSRRLASVRDQAGLCAVSVRLISETFEALSVSIWLQDEHREQLIVGASTAPRADEFTAGTAPAIASGAVGAALRLRSSPFDLEAVKEPWAEELRRLNSRAFPNGGNRWCVPLRSGEQCLGALVLADRVNGADYTGEQLQLLRCIAGQVTSLLLNLRLANELARSREMEAFRTMSAFFVHDLKNAAASLNLMLKNLPVHFDDPAFREDALRGIGNTARRIDETIDRLTALRQRPDFKPVETDLNQIVSQALDNLDGMPHVELTRELQPLPRVLVDREQIQSVVTNLLLNARDALGPEGRIRVSTEDLGDRIVLSVADDGCGMSAAFLEDSLFRPFQSTKKNGLGIGMFQSRMIVETHRGTIRVESETGKGSTFQVSLPVRDPK